MIYSSETVIHHLEGGRVGLGEYFFPGRRARGHTYKVRLSRSAAQVLEVGDEVEWWDTDSTYLPAIDCAGKITKPSGLVYHLCGSRDAGIDTGHPPHLGLKMVQKWKVCWESAGFDHYQVAYAPWGTWYRYRNYCFPPLGEIHSHEQMLREGAEVFSGEPVIRDGGSRRYRMDIKYHGSLPSLSWKTGWQWYEKKIVKMADTDQPLITRG